MCITCVLLLAVFELNVNEHKYGKRGNFSRAIFLIFMPSEYSAFF